MSVYSVDNTLEREHLRGISVYSVHAFSPQNTMSTRHVKLLNTIAPVANTLPHTPL